MGESFLVYTDGACRGNPGPGGWGAVLHEGGSRREISGGESQTTNNRMELTAAIMALESLPADVRVTVVTDSEYVRKGVTQWTRRWRRNGWRTASGTAVKNEDLWKRLLAASESRTVHWKWVRGHAGDPENEAADRLARTGIERTLRSGGASSGARTEAPEPSPSRQPQGGASPNRRMYTGWMLSLGLAQASEAAAVAASDMIGRGDETEADRCAVEAMRRELNRLDVSGRVVIGEGERDEAPMLYIGEEVGSRSGVKVDIALDPLEGTTLCAKSLPNALSVIAMGPRGSLLHAPDVYMSKIAVGPGVPGDAIDLDAEPADNVRSVARAKGVSPQSVSVCVLERPRHDAVVQQLRDVGASVRFITDGDVAAVMHASQSEQTGIDMYVGIGGAPEGVLAAAALRCMGGHFQGRLLFSSDAEVERARRLGIDDLDRRYSLRDLVSDDVIFAATGVTDGSLLKGARRIGDTVSVETLLLNSHTGSARRIRSRIRHSE